MLVGRPEASVTAAPIRAEDEPRKRLGRAAESGAQRDASSSTGSRVAAVRGPLVSEDARGVS